MVVLLLGSDGSPRPLVRGEVSHFLDGGGEGEWGCCSRRVRSKTRASRSSGDRATGANRIRRPALSTIVPTPELPYGCLHCATAASFKGDTARMPKTCPTRTHPEIARDSAPATSTASVRPSCAPRTPRPSTRTGSAPHAGRPSSWPSRARAACGAIGVAFCVSLARRSPVARAQDPGRGARARAWSAAGSAPESTTPQIGLAKAHPEKLRRGLQSGGAGQVAQRGEGRISSRRSGLCIGHDLVLQEECDGAGDHARREGPRARPRTR